MRETKDSGVSWVKKIPSEWQIVPLKSQFSFGKGLSITKSDLSDAGSRVLSYGQIHAKTNAGTSITPDLLRFVPESISSESPASLAKRNGFIFADTSEDLDGCGNCNYVDCVGVYAGYHTILLSPKSDENWKYLGYLFKTDAWRFQIRKNLTDVKVFSISQKVLKGTTILVPPKSERNAIVAYLDKKCAAIDEAIAKRRQIIEKLGECRQSVISSEFDCSKRIKIKYITTKVGSGKTPKGGSEIYVDTRARSTGRWLTLMRRRRIPTAPRSTTWSPFPLKDGTSQ